MAEIFFGFFKPQKEFGTQTNILQSFFLHAKFIFIFCVHNVVLDIQKFLFPFLMMIFFKEAQNAYLFCMACLCMPRSVHEYLKTQTLKFIVFESFCQNLKLC